MAEEDISELKTIIEGVRMNMITMNGRIKKNTESVKEIKEILETLKTG